MKEKRLPRRWARLCWLLRAFAAGILAFGLLLRVIPAMMVGCVLLFACMVVWTIFLRCPHCGKDLAIPQWNSDRRFYCKRCGKPFLFDDDPPDRAAARRP